jgi:hypothetical protein
MKIHVKLTSVVIKVIGLLILPSRVQFPALTDLNQDYLFIFQLNMKLFINFLYFTISSCEFSTQYLCMYSQEITREDHFMPIQPDHVAMQIVWHIWRPSDLFFW